MRDCKRHINAGNWWKFCYPGGGGEISHILGGKPSGGGGSYSGGGVSHPGGEFFRGGVGFFPTSKLKI